jgi:hypothetical protein
MLKICLVSFLIAFLSLPARAATTESYATSDPRANLSTIFYTGVGGAVLGLSTLSFYGRPQDHLPNIAIGFAVGIIFGAGYVTLQAANRHAPAAAGYVPATESEMALSSSRARSASSRELASALTPAQWAWTF